VPGYLCNLKLIVSHLATLQSWSIKYVGNASDFLYEHLASNPKDENKYARYTSIVQSSGMGKSRTIDELSKKHLVVPLNLRVESNGKFLGMSQLSRFDLNARISSGGRGCSRLASPKQDQAGGV
jgi:hypothetical protein